MNENLLYNREEVADMAFIRLTCDLGLCVFPTSSPTPTRFKLPQWKLTRYEKRGLIEKTTNGGYTLTREGREQIAGPATLF